MSQRLSITVTFSEFWRTSVAAIIAYCGYVFRVILLASLAMPVAVVAAQKLLFDIPQSSANVALREYAIQAHRQILIPHEVVKEYNANSVAGYYFADDALDLLLENSGLEAVINQNGILIIKVNKTQVREGENMHKQKLIKQSIFKKVAGILFAGLFGASSAGAQQVEEDAGYRLEEVIVTAQKRVQNAQDIGKSINVFNSESLDRAGIKDVSRLAFITPGLAFAQRGNDYKLTLRGANSENTDRAEPVAIGVFVDGLYRVRAAQAGNAFLDVESVEVLKGPQGTLFGRNTLGGAVLIKTHKPNIEKLSYGLSFTVGEFSHTKTEGYINIPLSDSFAVRIAGAKDDMDGWIKNLGASNDLGEVDDITLRVSALWEISDSFSALLSYFHYESDGSALGAYGYQSRGTLRDPDPTSLLPIQDRMTHANGILDPINPRGGALGTRADLGPWEIYRDSPFIRDVSEKTTALELNWDLGSVSIKSQTSYTDYFNLANVDGDYSEGRLLEESRLDDMKAWSQELQVSSNTDGRLEWVAGLYYATEDFNQAFFRNWLGFAGTAAEAAAGTPNLAECGNAFSVVPRAAVADATDPNAVCPGQFAGNPTDLKSKTFGVFVHGSYDLTDRVRLNAGLRYSKDDMDYLGGRILLSTGVLGQTVQVATVPAASESWDQITWEIGIEFDVFNDSLFYASASTGFLSGSFNPNGSTFDQQEVQAYEIGLKNRLLDNRVELNISAYRNEYTNMLAGILDDQSITQKINGGSLTANGIEIDLKALITENLTLTASMALQDSTYDEFGASNRFQLGGSGPVGFSDLSGKDTPWAPSVAGNLSVSYDIHSAAAGMFTPHLQLAYSGSHWTTGLQQFDLAKQAAYAKLDARLYWTSPDQRWNAQAFVENIANEAILQHTIVGGSDIIQVSWGKPRMWGVKFGYNFN